MTQAAKAVRPDRARKMPGERGLSRAAAACFAAACVLAVLVLLSWILDQWKATAMGADYVPVAPSTALLFLGLGTAGLLRVWRPGSQGTRQAARAAIGVTLGMALLVWAGYVLGVRLPVERWLSQTTRTVGAIPAGFMSPLTAAVFLLAAFSLLFQLPLLSRRLWQRQTAAVLALAVVVHGAGVALGYALRVPVLYGEAVVPMAALTAYMFLLLGSGLLFMAGGDVWPLGLFVPQDVNAPLRRRSAVGLLALFLIFAAAIGATSYFYAERLAKDAETSAYETLAAIANLKLHEIAAWRGERLGDAAAMAGNPLACGAAASVLDGTAGPAAREKVGRWLASLQVYAGYRSICLVDREGRVVLSAGEPVQGLGPPGKAALEQAVTTGKPVFTDLHRPQEVPYIHLDLLAPIRASERGPVVGAVMIRIDPGAYLYPLLASWPAPTRTGETLLVRREGNEVVFVSPLRFRRGAALDLRLPVGTPSLPASLAATGKEGDVEGRDYAGREVLAYVRSMPGSPWSIVSKADRSELLEPARRAARGIFLTALFIILAMGGAMASVWRHQAVNALRAQVAASQERHALLKHFEYLVKYANDIILLADARGRYVEVNDAALRCYGYTREEMLALNIVDTRAPQVRADLAETMRQLVSAGEAGTRFETVHQRKDGSTFPVEISARFIDVEGSTFYQAIVRDITERKRIMEEHQTAIEFLRIVNENLGLRGLIGAVTAFIQERSGCEAVGIRLHQGEDYPYYETRGFPAEFVVLENSLCARDDSGEIFRDSKGDPRLECMCGNVICGRFNPAKPFFTPGGSFWSNSTTRLLATTTDADRQARTRNRCNGEGYESVALIPLPLGDRRLGLLQMNDHRPNMFTLEGIELWERLAGYLAVALSKRQTEEALLASEDKFKCVFENSVIGKSITDPSGELHVNKAFCEMLGYTEGELAHRTWAEITHPDDMEASQRAFDTITSGEKDSVRFTKRYLHKDGSVVWAEVGLSVRRGGGGEVLYFMTAVNDITARKRAEDGLARSAQELARHADELARSNAELQQFAYVASHDLQEPLRIISSYAQLLDRRFGAKLDGEAKEFMAFIVDAAQRMQRLINDLLDYSRVGTRGSGMAPVNTGEVLAEAMANLKLAIEEAGAEITSDSLPTVLGDRRQLVQLFQNLLSNAVRFKASSPPRIHVSASKKGREWVFSIQDNGIGIDPQFKDRIFIIFQRLHGREEYPGTGIGLAICQKIVQRHKGKIWVESRPGEGSTFFFTLPKG